VKRLQRFWDVAYHPVRPYLLLRGLYLLLAGDVWLGMVEHGARYGVGGFNVAHFACIDRVLPLPSPALYVGLLIFTGALSLLLALGPRPRWLRALLAVAYTFGWIISIHDSYQHHYLLSWLLTWCVAFPDVRGEEAASGAPPPSAPDVQPEQRWVRGWGLPMTAVTCAIVYTFTGISKSEPEWRSGDVLQSLTHSMPIGDPRPGKFDGLRDLLVQVGVEEGLVWPLLALSTVALQWTIALGYLAAPARDARPSPARTFLVTVGLFGALSFHAVAELFEVFEIGIFSYYMIWMAIVLLSPSRLLRIPAQLLIAAGRRAQRLQVQGLAAHTSLGIGVAAAAMLTGVGALVPLPGAMGATLCVATVSITWILLAADASARQTLGRHLCLTAFVLWLTLVKSSVPFDYYRRGAGELARMGQLREALLMYRRAEQYAPAGESRRRRIAELERQLRDAPE
jgi:hypothetical protein